MIEAYKDGRPGFAPEMVDAMGGPPYYNGTLSVNQSVWGCGNCGFPFRSLPAVLPSRIDTEEINYCPHCGLPIEWEAAIKGTIRKDQAKS